MEVSFASGVKSSGSQSKIRKPTAYPGEMQQYVDRASDYDADDDEDDGAANHGSFPKHAPCQVPGATTKSLHDQSAGETAGNVADGESITVQRPASPHVAGPPA